MTDKTSVTLGDSYVLKKIIGATATAALVLFACASRAEASSITVDGSTLGCFGLNCSNFTLNPTDAVYELTFNGTSFSTTTDLAGSGSVTIGTFDRGNVNIGNPPPPGLNFVLQVTFTVPVGVNGSPTSFTAFITGQAASPFSVDFDNTWQSFTYGPPTNLLGSGGFDFRVLDTLPIENNSTGWLVTGEIRNATFTPAVVINPNAAVPEPGTLVLLATGLTALGLRIRKSARKS